MNGFGLGVLLARERLRGFGGLFVLLLGCGAVYALGVIERRRDAASAADTVLTGAVFGIALPIFAYLLSDRVCAGQQLSRSVDVLARHGTDRRMLVLGLLLGSALCMALIAALLTTVALLGARAPSSSAFLHDLRISVGISLLAGEVYALWFGVASLFGKRGGGRKCALIVDFLLGASSSLLALPLPRGHVRNLLGGTPVHDFSQASAWLALGVIGVMSLTLGALRSRE
jgi:ABC-type transport system involved in multi-copper enzyme maturation permease subunit